MTASPPESPSPQIDPEGAGLETREMLRRVEGELFGRSDIELPTLGRFSILGRLGEGGMGTVFSAYDPDLDRKIAIKVLRSLSPGQDEGHARLLREAQALAKLAHPNVVAIHEVGLVDDRVFLALEYVGGGTLATRIADGDPPLDEKLEWLVQAGRGLQAAHARGVVHRDVKPANILIGRDGRARVSDFGLATDPGGEGGQNRLDQTDASMRGDLDAPTPGELGDGGGRVDAGGVLRTKTGARVGTPAFMAPEQIDGGAVDARTDQFGFCVTVFRALEGVPPFAGQSLSELRKAMRDGPLPAKVMPAWLARLIAQGLAEEPGARHPSMEGLVREIERGRAPRRLGRPVLALSVAATAGVVAWVAAAPERVDRCDELRGSIDDTWGEPQRTAAAQAYAATELAHADETWRRTSHRLDEYAASWRDQAGDSCRSTFETGTQSDEAHDLRVACLGRAREELAWLAGLIADADRKLVNRSDAVIDSLPNLEACADPAALRDAEALPDDPDKAALAQQSHLDSARARTLMIAGRIAEAKAAAAASMQAAEDAGWQTAIARALLVRAKSSQESGDPKVGEEDLRRAIDLAEANAADRVLAESWVELMSNVCDFQGRTEELEPISRRAAAAVARLGNPPALQVRMLGTHGRALSVAGDYKGALVKLEAAAAIARSTENFSPDTLVTTQHLLANARADVGDPEGAASLRLDTIEVATEALGLNHPRNVVLWSSLAVDYMSIPDNEQALAAFDRALALSAELGRSRPAHAVGNRGLLLVNMGRFDEALLDLDEAIALRVAKLGDAHPMVGVAMLQKSAVLLATNRLDDARDLLQRADAILAPHMPEEHPYRLEAAVNLASVAVRSGDPTGARDTARGALSRYLEHADACSQEIMSIREVIAEAEAALEDHAAALVEYTTIERCWERRPPERAGMKADAWLSQAQSHRALGNHGKARDLATRARDAYAALGDPFADKRIAAARFLDTLARHAAK